MLTVWILVYCPLKISEVMLMTAAAHRFKQNYNQHRTSTRSRYTGHMCPTWKCQWEKMKYCPWRACLVITSCPISSYQLTYIPTYLTSNCAPELNLRETDNCPSEWGHEHFVQAVTGVTSSCAVSWDYWWSYWGIKVRRDWWWIVSTCYK